PGRRVFHVAIPVHAAPDPLGIVEHEMLEEANAPRLGHVEEVPPALAGAFAVSFTAKGPPGKNLLTGSWIFRPGIYLSNRVELDLREARRRVAALAHERRRIELAAARVVDD